MSFPAAHEEQTDMRWTFSLSRRAFLRTGAATLLGAGVLGAYTCEIEPFWVEFVHRELPIAHLPEALEGQTLVQLSDLHVGRVVSDDFLCGAFAKVRELEPDILVVTGDFMTADRDEQVDHVQRVLEHLPHGRLATLAVLGNHDYGCDWRQREVAASLCRGLSNLGVQTLRNASQVVQGLTIAGLDDFWSPCFDPVRVLASLQPDQANLVLCHNPDAVDAPVWSGYRGWILSGHTHGGQCRPPFLPPLRIPVRNKRYTAGEFDLHDGRHLYINRALGNLWQVRFNVRPEVTVFTLRRA
jgi:predicted MPP superfamily phosphohydrolase